MIYISVESLFDCRVRQWASCVKLCVKNYAQWSFISSGGCGCFIRKKHVLNMKQHTMKDCRLESISKRPFKHAWGLPIQMLIWVKVEYNQSVCFNVHDGLTQSVLENEPLGRSLPFLMVLSRWSDSVQLLGISQHTHSFVTDCSMWSTCFIDCWVIRDYCRCSYSTCLLLNMCFELIVWPVLIISFSLRRIVKLCFSYGHFYSACNSNAGVSKLRQPVRKQLRAVERLQIFKVWIHY